jgi:hypothetical protein
VNIRQRSQKAYSMKYWLGSVAALGVLGCDSTMDDGRCGSQAAGSANLAVWWGTASGASEPSASDDPENAEGRALGGLIDKYKRCNPDVTPTTQSYPDKAALIEKLNDLPLEPTPAELNELPDVVQLNAGETALAYSACDGKTTPSIAPVLVIPNTQPPTIDPWASPEVGTVPDFTYFGNALAEGAVWFQYRKSPAQAVEYGGMSPYEPWIYQDKAKWLRRYISCQVGYERQYWVTPIGIHHLNRLYYNIDAVRDTLSLGEGEDPKPHLQELSLAAWVAVMGRPRPQGQSWFALPNDHSSGWALNLLAAENIKVSLNLAAGRTASETDVDNAMQVMNVMHFIRRVSQAPGKTWSVKESMAAVEDGRAVFTVMGDWSLPDVDPTAVGMIDFPGTRNALVYTIDGFVSVNKNPTPGKAGATSQAKAWMHTVSDQDVASQFAAEKGAVTIGNWLENVVKNCAEEANKAGTDCWVVPALSMRNQRCDAAETMLAWAHYPAGNREKAISHLVSCESDLPVTDDAPEYELLPRRTVESPSTTPGRNDR